MSEPQTRSDSRAFRTARSSRVARGATWASSLAGSVLGLGIIGIRAGLWAPLTGFGLFVLSGLLGGLLSFVLGSIALFLTRGGRDPLGRRRALIGTGFGLGLLALVLVPAASGLGLPRINDITTDLADPPAFASADDVGEYAGRDMSYPTDIVEQVRAAYPDIRPVETDRPPNLALERALSSAESLGWEITRRDPASGVFDARESTAVFRFVDDITVRVRPSGSGSRVDIRSKSRDGQGDLGANAARIRRFSAEFERGSPALR